MNALVNEINETQVEQGGLHIWWIGQEGFVFKSPGQIIYIDPYLSTYAERITRGKPNEHVRIKPAPMKPAHFVIPECARDTMRGFGVDDDRIHTMKGDDELHLKGIHIHAIPAKHEEFDKHPQKGYPYLSYLINIDGVMVFHAGDTIPYNGQAERLKKHRIDLAFLPVNGRDEFRHGLDLEGNFTCAEAVRFALDIDAGLTIPMHYDMFSINTADVNEFRTMADKQNLRYVIMDCAGSIGFLEETKNGTQR
jgi:L-ascorbate metabolism protein UlaG (beta-lactamase superfamily)